MSAQPEMRVLSGLKPTGAPHLGNWFGAMRQFVGMQSHPRRAYYFIADLHGLDGVRDAALMREYTHRVAVDYLACGLDPAKATLFVQSEVPEVSELMWILGSVTPMGLLERMHAYKDAIAKGREADFGLFAYPVLMAADILAYASTHVPVGKDQKQHVEFTRDVAVKFNRTYCRDFDPQTGLGGVLTIPEPYILEDVAVVPGTDGQKMSKSYGNTIPMFGTDKEWEKSVSRIVTDSRTVEEPKDPATCNVFQILKLFLTDAERTEMEARYRAGGMGYGVPKKMLLAKIHERFDGPRARRAELDKDRDHVRKVLDEGRESARAQAVPVLAAVKRACGLTS
jgi:tryptophanyl-tRNA synthetase